MIQVKHASKNVARAVSSKIIITACHNVWDKQFSSCEDFADY